MKTESTIATSGLVTPKLAIASRSHTTWKTRLQKPETKEKAKNQLRLMASLRVASARHGPARGLGPARGRGLGHGQEVEGLERVPHRRREAVDGERLALVEPVLDQPHRVALAREELVHVLRG